MPLRAMVTTAIVMMTATTAMAQSRPGVPTGHMVPYSAYDLIATGDTAKAEEALSRQQRIHPAAPEVALNLASIYARTGRVSQAAELYRRVTSMPSMAMDMPDGSIRSSHVVAAAGMARIRS